jgi:nucleoside-diphosphate-sugar epimerase
MPEKFPQTISSVDQLDEMLSEPTPGVVETMAALKGDIMVLGAAGKMGPSLSWMARRASDQAGVKRRIIGVSRFSSGSTQPWLNAHGIETISCDLLEPEQLAKLPEIPNVVYMAAMKFGSTGQEARTWAMNCFLPGMVCQKFHRSRIVAFSSGNIYGMVPVTGTGSTEKDFPNPVGDYATSVVGRERIFEHFSRTLNIPVSMIRLNYAVELRYGALVDLAQRVAQGQSIDLSMGYVNVIWQGDANAMTLRSFDAAANPPFLLNVAGPEFLRVRDVCQQFGKRLNKTPQFVGTETATAHLADGSLGYSLYGKPRVGVEHMMDWIAAWIQRGGETLGKPTHFETRNGKF